ncbi:hypothetical protein SASPL_146862 [Salvia splendens]|uniref:Uncharacterized protein n=1 Tax=Salvia splendens TaxID=180675 RepID=A0A8X8Z5Z3_SALSN|nr:hypothetical protein SASPL_146862 [Salvia splendens]
MVGAFMATDYLNLLPPDARSYMNKIVFVAFTPSLVFGSLNGGTAAVKYRAALVEDIPSKDLEADDGIHKSLLLQPVFGRGANVVAAILGFIFGAVAWLGDVIIGENAPLGVIYDSISLPTDPLFRFVLMIQFTLPPAMNIGANDVVLGTMTQLFDVAQEECVRRVATSLLAGDAAEVGEGEVFEEDVVAEDISEVGGGGNAEEGVGDGEEGEGGAGGEIGG